ncbi:TPA: recombinase family protein [Streptococcus pyogenes serotype M1]|nr:recombinase family protein [Streptococcus pyogenes serotype M1]HER0104823.1 recombinase family protein [Streptococcus pyogenes]HEQ9854845.1 recombinase family protein [Streptococcus pyogenes serotype M1]HEQ9859306.1 recombinase family protein [Streptococcus pyogenes serotype M1]HEQ9860499.1 recombinase family protein [Streptococcus pyogenes serotype M1]
MARTANRRIKSEEQLLNKESINSFQTAIYARISRDKKEKPSDSIENQIALCESFIQKSEDFSLAGIYKDIAKTGTDFERPDFENLMDEVRMGKVNCIVVKDLSRFGRNYTELGNFIEKIFPFLGVRFVAVNDNLDTFHMDDPNKSLEVILKNIVNETYATDISKKVSSSHQMRIKQGGFICGAAPYGYVARKDEDGIRRLYPDENTAPIVKEIFAAYLKGLSTLGISKLLLEKRVYIATDYRKFGKAVSDSEEVIRIWQPTTILQVLKNRAYTGTLIQGRNQKHLYEGKSRERLSEEHWTVTENAHEAIISMDTFEKVQEKISEKAAPIKRSRKENATAKDDTIFRGMVYCNLCQKRMSVHRQLSGKRTVFYFICNRFGEYKAEKCGTAITEVTLQNTVKAAFDTILLNNKKSYKAYLDGYADKKREVEQQKEKELTEIGRRISGLSRLQSEYYEKYVLGDWRKEDFEREKEHLHQKKKELEHLKEKQIAIFEEEKRRLEEKHKYLKALFKGKTKKWDKEFVKAIIDKIFIGKDHTVEIQFNFEETPVITEKIGRKVKR